MIPNYYRILGVPPDATLESIKRAYRQKAMRYHPDRGGSHAQMLEVNEAFEVLADPALRPEYDFARAHPENYAAQERSAAESSQAREQAENYPREWAEFESWMNGIARDVKSAKFGQTKVEILGMKFPTAGESKTGWLLIIGGGIAGLNFWNSFIADIELGGYIQVISFCASICLGAWIGVGLHGLFGAMLPEPSSKPKQSASASQNIVQCPGCSQRLRFPPVTSRIQITCSSCQHVFIYDPTVA
jgi:hypothetical protein